MRDSWQIVALGELARQSIDPISVEPEVAYVNLGVQWYAKGVFFREPKIGSEIKAKTLFRVRPGQFIYNRLFATEGSFALVTAEAAEGVVSNEFPVFDLDEQRILPDFLFLHFQQPAIWEQVAAECVGTTKSRKRWKEDRFTQHVIALPPLVEQRRIVDLIGTIDDTIDGVDGTLTHLNLLRDQIVSHAVNTGGSRHRLQEISDIQFGFAFRSDDFSDTGIRLLRGDNIGVNGIRWDGTKCIPESLVGKRETTYGLVANDLVVGMDRPVISGGVRVAMVDEKDLPCLLVQRVARVRTESKDTAARILAYMKSEHFSHTLLGTQTGSHVPHLSAGTVRTFEIPDSLLRGSGGDALVDLHQSHRLATFERQSLQDIRAAVLAVLLSGEHEIPEAYDEMIEEVA